MDHNGLITRVQTIVYLLRRGQWEKVLAILTVALFGAPAILRQVWQEVPQAAYLLLYALGAASALWLVYRVWKTAAPPPPPPDVLVSSAIKGLLPFTVADGKLFARLGRRTEVQSLLGLAQDRQIGISVVRGESGSGKTSLLQAGLAYALGKSA